MLRVKKRKPKSVDNLHQSLHTSYNLFSLASLLQMFGEQNLLASYSNSLWIPNTKLSCTVIQKTGYLRNYVPTNQQIVDNPRTVSWPTRIVPQVTGSVTVA